MYTLVICEKPDAAKRVADALSAGTGENTLVEGVQVHNFTWNGEEFMVCSAQGHVYGVSDPVAERTVYPVFDVEWFRTDLVDEKRAGAGRRISAIKKLAMGASKFVNACDFDLEGETIGFNLLRYACGGKDGSAFRAKFSTLTDEDLRNAFNHLESPQEQGPARAGRARHSIDFVWGVNLSRALSQCALGRGRRYRTISIGRVQGPTLGFLVQKEREIQAFVPIPYWKAEGLFEKGGKKLTAPYSAEKIPTNAHARKIRADCLGKEGVVDAYSKRTVQVGPPAPFDVGGLQKEAYRAFGFTPSKTLQIAERLYLDALISYPRTGSERLPPSLDLKKIIADLGMMAAYSQGSQEILKGEVKPVQGSKSDPAHPAIHPTGKRPHRPLKDPDAALFDLVVRRFFAAFGQSARRELVGLRISVGEHLFVRDGGRTVYSGWMNLYGRYGVRHDDEVLVISEGDRLRVLDVALEEKFSQKPSRFNQSSLLERMEREVMGTKATRADIISTLIGRGYVSGETMEVTDLGLTVAETMERYAPSIVSTKLTRNIEDKLDVVAVGRTSEKDLLRQAVRDITDQLVLVRANEEAVGREINLATATPTVKPEVLGGCPVCKTGELRIIRSKATGKRFVGCSNYRSGCRASAPLPQKGKLETTASSCGHCSWPVVYVVWRRSQRLCVNPGCPGKKK